VPTGNTLAASGYGGVSPHALQPKTSRRMAATWEISRETSATSALTCLREPAWGLTNRPLALDLCLPDSVLGPVECSQGRFSKQMAPDLALSSGRHGRLRRPLISPAATRRGFFGGFFGGVAGSFGNGIFINLT
jgi:hypothetical protein